MYKQHYNNVKTMAENNERQYMSDLWQKVVAALLVLGAAGLVVWAAIAIANAPRPPSFEQQCQSRGGSVVYEEEDGDYECIKGNLEIGEWGEGFGDVEYEGEAEGHDD